MEKIKKNMMNQPLLDLSGLPEVYISRSPVVSVGALCGEDAREVPGYGPLLLQLDQHAHVARHQLCKRRTNAIGIRHRLTQRVGDLVGLNTGLGISSETLFC